MSRYFADGLSNELESIDGDEIALSNIPSLSSLASSFLSNSLEKGKVRTLKSNTSHSEAKTHNSNLIDYVGVVTNKQSKSLTVQVDTLKDVLLETSVFVADVKKSFENEPRQSLLKKLSIGDKILSINGHFLANKSLAEVNKLINTIEKNFTSVPRFQLTIQKNDYFKNLSEFSSSLFSLDSQIQLKFASNDEKSQQSLKFPESSIISSNSISSSCFNNNVNRPRKVAYPNNNNKLDVIRPLYFDNEQAINGTDDDGEQQPNDHLDDKSKLFDKIVNGSIKYEDLVKNFHEFNRKEAHLNDRIQVKGNNIEQEEIRKIYL